MCVCVVQLGREKFPISFVYKSHHLKMVGFFKNTRFFCKEFPSLSRWDEFFLPNKTRLHWPKTCWMIRCDDPTLGDPSTVGEVGKLDGGFKYFSFSPRSLGKMNPIWRSYVFRWVEIQPPTNKRWYIFVGGGQSQIPGEKGMFSVHRRKSSRS